jgi:GT2 family glycosyltransferase
VLTPVYDPDPQVLAECLESVRRQTYADWEHVLVDDASPAAHVWPQLLAASEADGRRRVQRCEQNQGIVGASNRALAAVRGSIVVLLDHDDLLAPTALERVAEVFDADDLVDYVYSDEDVLVDGRRTDPFYKPDWSPERLRNQMYTCHVSAFRTEVVRDVGGFRDGVEGSQDWDLVLRVTEVARRIVHVPEVLYHWRVVPTSVLAGEDVKPYAYESAARALAEHAERVGLDVEVVEQTPRGYFRLVRVHREHPLVSIVIPTRCSRGVVWGVERVMVLEAVRSIVERSSWPELEVVLVVDRPDPAELAAHDQVMAELAELLGDRLVVVDWDRPFNFSEKCNAGAAAASGEHLVFLNDDVEVIDGNWLEVLVGFTREPDVGAAGLRLVFSDGRLQHGGHVLLGGNPGHLMFGMSPEDTANRMALSLDREVAGVTAACLAIRAEVFDEVGGFSTLFAGNYNDVDLCCKLRHCGYRVVVSAQASLYHFESVTRDPTVGEHELALLRRRWWHELTADPYYNPNYGHYDNYPFPLSYP